jgi:hypothetical protein
VEKVVAEEEGLCEQEVGDLSWGWHHHHQFVG